MAAARQKEIKESIAEVTTTTLVALLAGFIATPGMWEKNSKRASARLAGARNVPVTFITLSQFKRQFNDDRPLWSALLTTLVDQNFFGPMSNSEQTREQY
jgi:hypothetical protein